MTVVAIHSMQPAAVEILVCHILALYPLNALVAHKAPQRGYMKSSVI